MKEVQKKVDRKNKQSESEIETLEQKIALEKRSKTNDYILLTKNKIPEDEFQRRRDAINEKIAEYKKKIDKLLYTSAEEISAAGIFDKYIGTENINRETVDELVKAIYVYENKRIEIVWNVREWAYYFFIPCVTW